MRETCKKCNSEFEGDICPQCGEPVDKSSTPAETKDLTTSDAPAESERESPIIQKDGIPISSQPKSEPRKNRKKFLRPTLEVIGGLLLIIFMFTSTGKVSKSDYDKLISDYNSLKITSENYKSENEKLKATESEYTEYRKRMQPYEKLEASEAEARKIESDKIIAEKKAADEKAAAEKKAQEDAAAQAAAEKAAAEKAAAEKAASASLSQKNALATAKNYLGSMSFSYSGLIEQLEYEGYSAEDSTYAVDNCGADWNEQAALTAANYLSSMSFSRQGLIEQLEYEGFSQEQAEYGVTKVGY